MKESVRVAYRCRRCRNNCLAGKSIILVLGSNDVLKRKLPDFDYDRNPISMNWEPALKILLHKLNESRVREVFISTIPNFVVPDVERAERYKKRD